MHKNFDVVVIGSGPAGIAVVERLYRTNSSVKIAIVERGPFLLDGHFYDSGGSIHDRDQFFALHQNCPWDGDLGQGGALLPAVGGRGIVGGSQLHRFYASDFTLWEHGRWHVGAKELDPYFYEAEKNLLGSARCVSRSQDYACAILDRFDAQHPPCGPVAGEVNSPDFGLPHRSSAQRISSLLELDKVSVRPRISLFSGFNAVELVTGRSQKKRVLRVRCVPSSGSRQDVKEIVGDVFVLAASPVESARLVLVSELGDSRSSSSCVGRYLSEHMYCRGYLDVTDHAELSRGPINVFIPPSGTALDDRYQIELRSMTRVDRSRSIVRVTGSAAMDPSWDNQVSVRAGRLDSYGMPRAFTKLKKSLSDRRRVLSMFNALNEVAISLGAGWLSPPVNLPCGASYHESGTLRVASSEQESAAAADGRLLGTSNVYVGDGAAFACVGVANPILTLTAMGYRLGDHLAGRR